MRHKTKKRSNLPSTILAALAKLDQRGTDETVSRAMAIVFEAFRLAVTRRSFTSDSLFSSAGRR